MTRLGWFKKCGFTLMEMMLVIAIVSILIGLLFAGIAGAIKQAKIAKARTAVSALAAASRAYYVQYGMWPSSTGSMIVNSGSFLVECFRGGGPLNPRGIVFMDFQARDLVRDPSNSSSFNFIDPFGKTAGGTYTLYSVYYDTNGDGGVGPGAGGINDLGNPSFAGGSVSGGVAVWSWGPDQINNWGSNTGTADDIPSWR